MSFVVGLLIWLCIVLVSMLVVSYFAVRWGRDPFGWALLSAAFGPIAIVALVGTRQSDVARGAVVELAPAPSRAAPIILAPCDGSPRGDAVARHIAHTSPRDARVVLLTVLPHEAQPRPVAQEQKEHQETVDRMTGGPRAILLQAGIEPEIAVAYGNAAEEIIRFAREHDVSQIVMGRRGAGLSKALLGSVSEKVVQSATRPVTVVD